MTFVLDYKREGKNMRKDLQFETGQDRLDYAEKKAQAWVNSLPKETVEQYGEANLLSDKEHEILMQLPDSKESRSQQIPDLRL